MPILASTTFVNAYGKASVVAVESASNLESMQGTQDVFIVKYSTLGKALWSARIASPGGDVSYAIATDSSGNVYVTGQGGNTAVITAYSSNGVAFGTTLANTGSNDVFIVKYNTSGIVQWVARVASTDAESGYGIATDSSGNVYVTGQGGSGVVVTAFSSDGVAFGTTLPNAGSTDAFLVKYDTSGIVQWVARIASSGLDIGYGIATDSSGNVYVTGQGGSGAVVTAYSSNGVAFGTTLPNSGSNDAFLVKYNTSGIVQWVARVASSGVDIGYGIATDSSGNVYVTGQGGSGAVVTAFSSNGVAFGTTLPNAGGTDAFLVKYDTSGIVQWVARVASTGSDVGYAIATDSSGNVYVTGLGGSSVVVTAFSSNGVAFGTTLPSDGSNDVYVVKYDTSGIVQWVARVASTQSDIGFAIATDSSGNVYVTGRGGAGGQAITAYSSNGVAFGTLPNAGGTDGFIVKYNTSGIVQWVIKIASTGSDLGRAISVDSGGNIHTTGIFTGYSTYIYGQSLGLFSTLPNSGGTDAYIVKYNTSGAPQWVARIASNVSDVGYAIATDSSGNVYVTGQGGAATVTAYSSNGVAFGTTLPNTGLIDAFIVKYDTSGIVQWVARVASTGQDLGYGIATDSSGNVYVTGQGGAATVTAFSSNGVAFGTTLPNAGGTDAFLVKYNTSGIVQWVARVASTLGDYGYSITTDSSGNVYVTGQGGAATVTAYSSNGVAFGTTLPNAGVEDAFLVKYDTSGIVQWIARVASTGTDIGYGIATDSSGNVYVTGRGGAATVTAYSSDGVAFGTTLPNAGNGDTFIVKYNTSGIVQWVARVASAGQDIGFAITTDSSGNVYVTGQGGTTSVTAYSSNGVAFGTTLFTSGTTDVFIVKYNTSGIVQWVTRISSTTDDVGFAIATDSSGNVYVQVNAGSFTTSIIGYSRNEEVFSRVFGSGGLFKYNSDGYGQWAQVIRGTTLITNNRAVATDTLNNVYLTGATPNGQVTQIYKSDNTIYLFLNATGGLQDCFIVKYSSNTTPQWVARVASTDIDIGYGIATDSSGNVYVTGSGGFGVVVTAYSSNGVAFGTTLPNLGNSDAFIVKYNTSGIVQWVARVASTAPDIGYGIATDSSGNVYVTGQGGAGAVVTAFSSDGVAFGTTLPNSGSNDACLVKYNTSGIVQWVARVASSGQDIGYGIATDSSGNVYVTGQGGSGVVVTAYSSDGVAFGTTLPNAGVEDAFLVKYDTSGIVQWIARVASTGTDIGYGIATDSSGNVYVTGQGGSGAVVTAYSSDGVAFGTTLPNAGGTDAFLVKYNTSGIVQWVARVASTAADIGYGIATDTSGNVYVTGQGGAATVTAYSSNGVAFGTTLPNAGGTDAFLVKYNTSGIVQWVARVASTAADIGYGIATDTSGNVYVTGLGATTIVSAYNSDGTLFGSAGVFTIAESFVVKYNTNGTVQWISVMPTSSNNSARALSLDSSGNIYTTGSVNTSALIPYSA